MSAVKISVNLKKGYLISNTRTLDLLCQVIACMPINETYVLHFSL